MDWNQKNNLEDFPERFKFSPMFNFSKIFNTKLSEVSNNSKSQSESATVETHRAVTIVPRANITWKNVP